MPIKNNIIENIKELIIISGARPRVIVFQYSNLAKKYENPIIKLRAPNKNPVNIANRKGILE